MLCKLLLAVSQPTTMGLFNLLRNPIKFCFQSCFPYIGGNMKNAFYFYGLPHTATEVLGLVGRYGTLWGDLGRAMGRGSVVFYPWFHALTHYFFFSSRFSTFSRLFFVFTTCFWSEALYKGNKKKQINNIFHTTRLHFQIGWYTMAHESCYNNLYGDINKWASN